MKLNRITSRDQSQKINVGIVHIGLGAFMRAHLAPYTEEALKHATGNWGICAVNIRSNSRIVNVLQTQGYRYNIAEYTDANSVTLREISVLQEAIFAGNGHSEKLIERLQDPGIKIVSLTITEKGYFLNPANRQLLRDDKAIIFDLENPTRPTTAIGILVAALSMRKDTGTPPFTVLSCDNMPDNGTSTKSAIMQFAQITNPELADWIGKNVHFPNSMVDRIVPAISDETLKETNRLLLNLNSAQMRDNAALSCERYSQWVIEDDFSQGRPPWELAGAEFVTNVAPYEAMKLRLLNGSHSLLAYLGFLGGFDYVSDCMRKKDYVDLLRTYMFEEAIPTLNMPEGTDLKRYAESLLQRFANDSLRHRTSQIAMDGSRKIPQRWLAGIDILLNKHSDGPLPKVSALGIAAWMRYVGGINEQGISFVVDDPLAEELLTLCTAHCDPAARVDALFQTSVFSQTALTSHSQFVGLVLNFYNQLANVGARKTIALLLGSLQA